MPRYNFRPHKKGDTFDGTLFSIVKNGAKLNLTSSQIEMDIRNKSGELLKRLTNAVNGGISLINPATEGQFKIDKQILDVDAGLNKYDIQITFSNGEVRTYLWGDWLILGDVTYDE